MLRAGTSNSSREIYPTKGTRDGTRSLARTFLIACHFPWRFAATIIFTICAGAMQLTVPPLLGRSIDVIQKISRGVLAANQGQEELAMLALLILAASCIRAFFSTLQSYYSEAVGHLVGYELRTRYYEKILTLSFSFHDRVHSGDLIASGILDIEGVRMFFGTVLVRFMTLLMLVGGGALLMLKSDFTLSVMALSFVPIVGWRTSIARLRLRTAWIELQRKLDRLSRTMEENLVGVRVVRAFRSHGLEIAKFNAMAKEAHKVALQRLKLRVGNAAGMTLCYYLAMGLVIYIGGAKVISGNITIGTLTSFLTYMTILQMPVRQIGLIANGVARASTCGSRLFALLDLDVAIKDAPDAKELNLTDGVLRFENVSFAYPGSEKRTVLNDVSFEARRGQTIGIVGPPGSGKSTIAHLIPRFYDVSGGRITIDGQDIRKATLQSLRRAVAVVQQDSFLFTTTIENNIAYGDPWAKESRIERASESAQLHNYVLGLPTGYDTVVGERGVSLSGGQRQRLSIARALMLKPAVMVFDDSTAAIDAATEQRIRGAMRRYATDRVTIIVAHRLSSLMHADQILFVEDGQIVERGTHEALLSLGGRYKALYDLQVRPGDEVLSA
ncbi:ABC transporter ATP-binding protein [Rhizobium leguminosarum]|uniref:ABC transporter ATP-binding protein n=1 Tax=Rhizobium leguminosarum TaxID=384 RepID=A0ACD5FDM4_RHILE